MIFPGGGPAALCRECIEEAMEIVLSLLEVERRRLDYAREWRPEGVERERRMEQEAREAAS